MSLNKARHRKIDIREIRHARSKPDKIHNWIFHSEADDPAIPRSIGTRLHRFPNIRFPAARVKKRLGGDHLGGKSKKLSENARTRPGFETEARRRVASPENARSPAIATNRCIMTERRKGEDEKGAGELSTTSCGRRGSIVTPANR